MRLTITTRAISVAGAILLTGAMTACSDDSDAPQAQSSLSPSTSSSCEPEAPPARPTPALDPPALPPLPAGSYVVSMTSNGPSEQYVIFVPQSVDAFHEFSLEAWPPAGFVLGGGDRESFEVELSFTTPSATGNAKARARPCDPSSVDLTIGLTSR